MASDKLLLISGDGHAALPQADYRPYLESRYHEAFDETLVGEDTGAEIDFFAILTPEVATRHRKMYFESGAIEGRSDSNRRVEMLNRDGVSGEILFPDGAPFAAGALGGSTATHFAPELVLAGARAYNRFLVDYVAPHKERLAGQALVILHDVSEAVRDIYWAAEHGLKAIVMPGMEEGLPLYWDACYEPLWSAAEETGLPLAFHGGIGQPAFRAAPEVPINVQIRIGAFEFPFWAHRPFWFLIWSGVLERHPKLRLIFTETHTDWVVSTLAQMDHSWEHSMLDNSIQDIVKMKPSQYYERQVWIGSSLLSRSEVEHRHQIGIHKMMFGVDFPHPEGCWGMTRDYLQATVGMTDMSESEIRGFLGLNAAKVYGFDTVALQPLVDTYGLSLEEVSTPIPPEREGVFWEGLDVFRPNAAMA
jgi:predicted TIM-barrel fold metal-dependent hydrolase